MLKFPLMFFLDISIIKVLFSEMRRPGDHVCCCCEESPDQTDDDNTLWLLNTPDLTLGLLSSSVVWILTPQIGIKIMGEPDLQKKSGNFQTCCFNEGVKTNCWL